jgi:hypothetical protein
VLVRAFLAGPLTPNRKGRNMKAVPVQVNSVPDAIDHVLCVVQALVVRVPAGRVWVWETEEGFSIVRDTVGCIANVRPAPRPGHLWLCTRGRKEEIPVGIYQMATTRIIALLQETFRQHTGLTT